MNFKHLIIRPFYCLNVKNFTASVDQFILSLLLLCNVIGYAQVNAKVHYVSIAKGEKVAKNPIKEYFFDANIKADKNSEIILYPEIEFQTIEGIGGSFNEIGGEALMSLPSDLQKEVSESLFSIEGAGFSFCRTAIGSSDFGIDDYSYSEVAEDFDMEHFSVDREKTTVIPFIQQAIKYNPNLKIFGSPWSPPGWMKYSGLMDRGNEFKDKNRLRNDPKIYAAYALYFSKYIQSYKENGIPVHRLLIQNENDLSTKYPSCHMPPDEMGNFIKDYLIDRFAKDKIDTKIWAGTFRTAKKLDALEFVANKEFCELVEGVGIQYTKSTYIQQMSTINPEVKIMHTEGNCFNGSNTIKQASSRLNEIAGYINYGSENYCYWNMILNETGKSGWGWKQNSLININRTTKEITYNPDYSVMALVSKYMKPGAVRIPHYSRSTLISIKYDNKIYLFIQNDLETTKKYDCQINDKTVSLVEIPGNSVAVIELDQINI